VLVTGAPILTLFLSSTRVDADVIVRLAVQHPQSAPDRTNGLQPAAQTVAKGWLRASHRALDPTGSIAGEPYHSHRKVEPLVAGQIYELHIELTHMAHLFGAGSRIRVELCCADSTITDFFFSHAFAPNTIGVDTFHHSEIYPSRISIPVLDGLIS
jgi:predicted acyl esterase